MNPPPQNKICFLSSFPVSALICRGDEPDGLTDLEKVDQGYCLYELESSRGEMTKNERQKERNVCFNGVALKRGKLVGWRSNVGSRLLCCRGQFHDEYRIKTNPYVV